MSGTTLAGAARTFLGKLRGFELMPRGKGQERDETDNIRIKEQLEKADKAMDGAERDLVIGFIVHESAPHWLFPRKLFGKGSGSRSMSDALEQAIFVSGCRKLVKVFG